MRSIVFVTFVAFLIGCGGDRQSRSDHSTHTNAANAANNSGAGHDAKDHAGPEHSTMASSPGAAGAPLELQFLDSMIAHHEGAVDMAELADSHAGREEIKDLAENIVDEQERQIAKMDGWRDGWFDGKTDAINMEFPGMAHGMGGMDMKKLAALKGPEFDVEFLRQMIPHHEGAVTMAKHIKANGARAELMELADDIITAQEAEIARMREWLAAWGK